METDTTIIVDEDNNEKQATYQNMEDINSDILIKLMNGGFTNPVDVINSMSLSDNQRTPHGVLTSQMIKSKMLTVSELKNLMKNKKIAGNIGFVPENCSAYISGFIKKFDIKFNLTGKIVSHNIPYDYNEVLKNDIDKLENDLYEKKYYNEDEAEQIRGRLNILKNMNKSSVEINFEDLNRRLRIFAEEIELHYSNKCIDDCLTEYVKENSIRIKSETYREIAHNQNVDYNMERDWDRLVHALFDDSEMSYECSKASLKKFMWQVKRKMVGLSVTNHNMIVIVGNQGSGKTTFVNRMLEPVEDVSIGTNMEELSDSRNVDLFDHYVMFLDEMSRADKADIETIKNVITTKYVSRRVLGTSKVVSKAQNGTFIGCTNKNLDQIINDETGIRRFIPLRFSNNPDWDTLNDMNFWSLWKSLDEYGEDPLEEHMDEIRNIQSNYRTKTSCEDWANHLNTKDNTSEFVNGRTWYAKYKEYEEEYYPHRNTSFSTWDREMKRLCDQSPQLGFVCNTINGKRYYMYSFGGSSEELSYNEMNIEKVMVEVNHDNYDLDEEVIETDDEFEIEVAKVKAKKSDERSFDEKYLLVEQKRRDCGKRPRSMDEIKKSCEVAKGSYDIMMDKRERQAKEDAMRADTTIYEEDDKMTKLMKIVYRREKEIADEAAAAKEATIIS